MSNQAVAKEILNQLGGNKFIVMTGAKQFVSTENSLRFRLPRADNGINTVEITLNGSDLYDVEFSRVTIRGVEYKKAVKAAEQNIYADMLVKTFEQTTKLYTKLF